jgi:hypothetical protein
MLKGIWSRPGALVTLIGGAGGGLLAVTLPLLEKDPVSRCPGPNHAAIGPPLNLVFVGLCAASFLAGGLLSDFQRRTDEVEDTPQSTADRNWLQAGLVGVLLILFLLLSYETYSLVLLETNQASVFWPITWFVRCVSTITSVATLLTLVVACLMCGFFGKWLWYRPRTYTPRR